ncbi:MAG: exodeoxyribonuclease VII large subunit, partial [Planctomycetota bacterium]|nr:exodeoxyribonuclease VII large subunit [Planctomycetota bacterium]
EDLSMKLRRALRQRADLSRSKLDRFRDSWALKQPEDLVTQHRQRMDELEERLRSGLKSASGNLREKLEDYRNRMPVALSQQASILRSQLEGLSRNWALKQPEMQVDRFREICRSLEPSLETGLSRVQERAQAKVKEWEGRLSSLNPKAVLERGYSITRLEDGTVIKDSGNVPEGTILETDLAKGTLTSRVEKKKHRT